MIRRAGICQKIWALDPDTLALRDEIDLGKGIGHQAVVLEK